MPHGSDSAQRVLWWPANKTAKTNHPKISKTKTPKTLRVRHYMTCIPDKDPKACPEMVRGEHLHYPRQTGIVNKGYAKTEEYISKKII